MRAASRLGTVQEVHDRWRLRRRRPLSAPQTYQVRVGPRRPAGFRQDRRRHADRARRRRCHSCPPTVRLLHRHAGQKLAVHAGAGTAGKLSVTEIA